MTIRTMNIAVKTEQPNESPRSTASNLLPLSNLVMTTIANPATSLEPLPSSVGAGGSHTSGPTVSFSLPPVVQHIVHSPSPSANGQEDVISDEEAKRRRELLARRPSYRKILNDLSCVELDLRPESDSGGESSEESSSVSNSAMTGSQAVMSSSTLSAANTISYMTSIPSGGLHLPTNVNGDLNVGGLLPSVTGPALLQYPLQNVGGPDLLGLKPLPPGAPTSLLAQGLMAFSPTGGPSSSKPPSRSHTGPDGAPVEEASRKREIRLLKNREAAKECRRKKKEYVKCLENRVTVLEAQNKQLIEELRALKDLYCRKAD